MAILKLFPMEIILSYRNFNKLKFRQLFTLRAKESDQIGEIPIRPSPFGKKGYPKGDGARAKRAPIWDKSGWKDASWIYQRIKCDIDLHQENQYSCQFGEKDKIHQGFNLSKDVLRKLYFDNPKAGIKYLTEYFVQRAAKNFYTKNFLPRTSNRALSNRGKIEKYEVVRNRHLPR